MFEFVNDVQLIAHRFTSLIQIWFVARLQEQ